MITCLIYISSTFNIHCILYTTGTVKPSFFAAAIDVNRIARELDFAGLQESIMSVTFCNIESEMVSQNATIRA